MTDRVGQRIGNYHLIRQLGSGGFAVVYLGEHIRIRKQVAVKVLHAHTATGEAKDNFLKEAAIVARLEHRHIISILDYAVDENDCPFLIMDYAPNGNLRDRHPRGGRLTVQTAVQYVKQAAEALQHAHSQHIAHCDIKPQNMLIGRDGDIRISDFGVALIIESTNLQDTRGPAGTPSYMAPEQFKGKPHLESDQYALAVVVYEWLCGELPFPGRTFLELQDQHLSKFPPSLQQKVQGISLEVEKVVLKALEKDPHDRFESVVAFAEALEQASRVPPESSLPHQAESLLNFTSSTQPAIPSGSIPIASQKVSAQKSAAPSVSIPPLLALLSGHKSFLRENFIILAACITILSFLVLGVILLIPRPPPSLAASTPTPHPTTGRSTTSGPTVTSTSPPVSPITNLGSLDFQGYCLSLGDTRASLDQNNAYGWRCVTSSGDHTPIDTTALCRWQYNAPNVLSRMVDYSDRDNWRCYSHVKNLGGIDFQAYCLSLGKSATFLGNTAYDWHCVSSGNQLGIDTDAACRWQYKDPYAVSSVYNYFDRNGWICLGAA